MRKIILAVLFTMFLVTPALARGKNLNSLVTDEKSLKVYLGDFTSQSEKVPAETMKNILKETLAGRNKEHFIITDKKENSDVIVSWNLTSYKYSNKDPIDNVVGGTTALIVDAMVDQNYAQVQIEYTVTRTKDMKKLWYRKEAISVTQTIMPEPDSIPKVLKEASKRFIYLCFGKTR